MAVYKQITPVALVKPVKYIGLAGKGKVNRANPATRDFYRETVRGYDEDWKFVEDREEGFTRAEIVAIGLTDDAMLTAIATRLGLTIIGDATPPVNPAP